MIQQNRQASKKNQRHGDKEQSDSKQKGVRRGIMGKEGEGSSRNMRKGPTEKVNSGGGGGLNGGGGGE